MSLSSFYIVTVNMGYGHERALYPLRSLAASIPGVEGGEACIISANTYPGIPKKDLAYWEGSRKLYEIVSRLKPVPILGPALFSIMDYIQRIEPIYPKRDQSAPTLQTKEQYKLIKKGWGKDLVERLNTNPLPLLTSFFSVAFFAEEHGYKGEIFCLCTDTDISRAWAPLNPKNTRINYLAPNKRVRDRLLQYGVPDNQIHLSGFPLPEENIGDKKSILKSSLKDRLEHLDPKEIYRKKYQKTIQSLFEDTSKGSANRPFTVTFAVGGAGAQREMGLQILDSLQEKITTGKVQLNLVAGNRQDVFRYYDEEIKKLHLDLLESGRVNIIFAKEKHGYFEAFNQALLNTDILWTKPSELSFYAGLGLPILMAPPVGAQEISNRAWLYQIGAGFEAEDPRYADEWLFDWLDSGWFAAAALNGFLHAPQDGSRRIKDIILNHEPKETEDIYFL